MLLSIGANLKKIIFCSLGVHDRSLQCNCNNVNTPYVFFSFDTDTVAPLRVNFKP
jgi:hypothetical protein